MSYVLLSILGVAGFVHILKFAQWRRQDVMAVGAVNYVVAAGVAVALYALRSGGPRPLPTALLALGVAVGVGYVATYVILHLGIAGSGAALSGTVTALGAIIPVLAAHFYWRDAARPWQLVGVALTLVALPLLGTRPRRNPQSRRKPALWILAALFLTGGAWQLVMKVVSRAGPDPPSHAFIMVLFVTAAVAMSLTAVLRRARFRWPELLTGAALGLANVAANLPFVLALQAESGTLVFATRAGGSVLLTVLVARFAWGERLRGLSWAGVGLATLALVLVNLRLS